MQTTCVEGRAVLFDLDGVLADSLTAIQSAWRDWARRRRLPEAPVLASVIGVRSEDIIRKFAAHLDPDAEAVWIEDREGTYAVSPCAGARELIQSLDGIPWGVVTSGRRDTAVSRLQRIGIAIPGVLVTASDVNHGKPDPEGFRLAAELLGVDITECVVIEDSQRGVRAGISAGARVIGIHGKQLGGSRPDFMIGSLEELVIRVSNGRVTLCAGR